jgi:hypothetical protein
LNPEEIAARIMTLMVEMAMEAEEAIILWVKVTL